MTNTTPLFETLREANPVTLSGFLVRSGIVRHHGEAKALLIALIVILVGSSAFLLNSSMPPEGREALSTYEVR